MGNVSAHYDGEPAVSAGAVEPVESIQERLSASVAGVETGDPFDIFVVSE